MNEGRDPVFRRLREAGRDPRVFRRRDTRRWVWFAIAALGLTAALPVLWPASTAWVQRTTPVLSLFFFLSAIGWWLRMKQRSFSVAAAFVVLLYALTAWAPIAFDVDDFTAIALLSSFAVFVLAGFNLVFILEEVVFDAHRELHLKHRAWSFVPTILVAALALALPMWPGSAIPAPAVWIAAVVWSFVYLGWWLFAALTPVQEGPVLRELHLLTFGTLAVTGIIDLTRLFGPQPGFVPSLLMYALLVGTWLYVSYTTLQRTHFLLRADNAVPWLCILLSASFALLQHASLHFRLEGAVAVTNLLSQRVAYLIAGVWLGLAFYVMQSLWRVLQAIRDDQRIDARGRILAGSLARVAETFMTTEQRLERMAARLYRGMDNLLPGPRMPPQPHGWDLEPEGIQRIEADSEE